jgi:hypothetical protein
MTYITPPTIATVELQGRLLDWGPWRCFETNHRPVGAAAPRWKRYRSRVLQIGAIEAARINETQMESGICQYTVNYPSRPLPLPKFDSFEQALVYLKQVVEFDHDDTATCAS